MRNNRDMPWWVIVLFMAIVAILTTSAVNDVYSAEPPNEWPKSVAVGQLLILDAPETSENVAWSVYPANTVFRLVDANHAIVIETAASGTVIVALADSTVEPVTVLQVAIVIGDPAPGPGPIPPPPPPPVEGKLHVLILYETDASQPGHLTQAQTGIIASADVLRYLDAHCADENGQPAYRFLDDDADVSNLADDWQTVIQRGLSAGKLPWLIVASDQGGSYEGELPQDVMAAMELLKRFGGE